ncbi:uncharacterized protein C1orf185 homolog [Chionomys nivalis]|uniref:uncharacterized protein C1orf185 homolog n=1 Tax=Chionomys nivalis TaxID=269649 RepID=UPI0025929F39|nr:uncharacterized protein C1orf185 homolog [Chionomys nivalis]
MEKFDAKSKNYCSPNLVPKAPGESLARVLKLFLTSAKNQQHQRKSAARGKAREQRRDALPLAVSWYSGTPPEGAAHIQGGSLRIHQGNRDTSSGFINFLTYFLAAGAISLGIGFLALSSALWFLICKRRELFRSPNIKSIDEKLKQRLYKQKAKPQSVFISRNFHTGQSQPQVEHREREGAQMKAVNSKDELCLPDPVDGESPDMLSVENGSSVTVNLSTSIPSSYCSRSMEAADEWFSNYPLEAKTPPEPLLGEPLAEKVLAYLSSISLEEWPRNTMNVTFCDVQKEENTKEMFSQRNTEAGIHNLPCDTE